MTWCGENAERRPVAWLDDDLGPDAEEWAAARTGTLLVRTVDEEGLTQEQTDALLAWARSLDAGPLRVRTLPKPKQPAAAKEKSEDKKPETRVSRKKLKKFARGLR